MFVTPHNFLTACYKHSQSLPLISFDKTVLHTLWQTVSPVFFLLAKYSFNSNSVMLYYPMRFLWRYIAKSIKEKFDNISLFSLIDGEGLKTFCLFCIKSHHIRMTIKCSEVLYTSADFQINCLLSYRAQAGLFRNIFSKLFRWNLSF